MTRYALFFFFILFQQGLFSQTSYKEHVELGNVHWLRNYDAALEKSKEENKPIFLLFQEVPGCATCRNYGKNVLSDPLIVDAIENEFIPLCIYNNKGGSDKAVLKKYDEPSWNNPVVRVINGKGKDVVSRLSGSYSPESVLLQMSLAIKQYGTGSPQYLELYKEELNAVSQETAYYKMYCFWTGEAHLGNTEGVLATEPGWMGGAEVVKVDFDPTVISKKKLDKYAQGAKCASVEKSTFRQDQDLQYYLKKSPYKYLALSALQRTKINSALANRKDPASYLSPTQIRYLNGEAKSEMIYHLPLEKAWSIMTNSD